MEDAAARVLMCECEVCFVGESEVRFGQPPAIGSQGRCILFVQEPQAAEVPAILKRFGWEVLSVKARRIDAATLEPASMEPFRAHFEACLRDGHALVWYA
jgi:hypothetical protein